MQETEETPLAPEFQALVHKIKTYPEDQQLGAATTAAGQLLQTFTKTNYELIGVITMLLYLVMRSLGDSIEEELEESLEED